MRKLSFTMCLLLATVCVCGQKKEVNNAYNFYTNGYLDRAKNAIDKAILNDETAKEAKTWMYRGNIYLRLADIREKELQWEKNKEDSLKQGKPVPVVTRDQQNNRAYVNLCTNCAEIAYEAYMKALELDENIKADNMGIATPKIGLKFCASFLYNEAVSLFGASKFEEAYSVLVKANIADPKQDHIVYLLAYTAELTNKTDIAKTNYSDMVRDKSKNDRAYQQLANIYKSENDTARMLKVMHDGEAIFMTKDTIYINFVTAYSFFLSWAGKTDEAADIMERALEKYPDDHIFLIGYGTTLSDNGHYEKAEKYLKKALEIKPDEVTAVFNLGTCYYNNYSSVMKGLSSIDDQAEYDRQRGVALELLEKARIEMEKAHEMDPKDRNTLTALRSIYTRMGKTNELKSINEKLDALK